MGQNEFEDAQVKVKTLPDQPPDVLLELYGLFKQATSGDVNTKRPGMLDFKGRAKHDAWESRKGMSREAAMDAYIETVNRLLEEHGQT